MLTILRIRKWQHLLFPSLTLLLVTIIQVIGYNTRRYILSRCIHYKLECFNRQDQYPSQRYHIWLERIRKCINNVLSSSIRIDSMKIPLSVTVPNIDWIINQHRWFSNLDAEQFLSEEHSFPLVPGLTPVVNIENVKSELLGSPFTACVDHKLEPDYSVSGCRYRQVDFQNLRVSWAVWKVCLFGD